VLPAPTQFEKWEATFFTFDHPRNVVHLRRPVLGPEGDVLGEPELHARLVEASGALSGVPMTSLAETATTCGLRDYDEALGRLLRDRPELSRLVPVILYRTLGPTLPHGAAAAAVLWPAVRRCVATEAAAVARAGFGTGFAAAEKLFAAIIEQASGVVFTHDEPDDTWRRVRTGEGRVRLEIPHLLASVVDVVRGDPPGPTAAWPFVLSAGQRRPFTANTIMRDPAWRSRDTQGALHINPQDAGALRVRSGGQVRIDTAWGSAMATVEVTSAMQPGHVALPNGYGLDPGVTDGPGGPRGVAPNELTGVRARDPWVGTPWHKFVPARLTRVVPGDE
jgi:anaerobic selenocysteine-containing dehydrogenase